MASTLSPSARAWRRSRELAQIAPAAAEKNIPVWGEIELFAQALAALKAERGYAPKVIAITGTNGKTTVTSLVGLLCERAGLATRVAGNISPAALDVLREVLDAEPAPLPVDAELTRRNPSPAPCRRRGYWNCPASSCTPPSACRPMRPRS